MLNNKKIYRVKIFELIIQIGMPLFIVFYNVYKHLAFQHALAEQDEKMTAGEPLVVRMFMEPPKYDTSLSSCIKAATNAVPPACFVLISLQLISALFNSFMKDKSIQSKFRRTYNGIAVPGLIYAILWIPGGWIIRGLGDVYITHGFGFSEKYMEVTFWIGALFATLLVILYIFITIQEIVFAKRNTVLRS